METGHAIWDGSHETLVTCCRFSADGRLVASASDLDHMLKLWDSRLGSVVHCISNLHTSTITSCRFSPTCDRICTTSMDKTAVFWDMMSQKQTMTLKGHAMVVSSCDFSSDERLLCTSSWDKTVFIWDIASGAYRFLTKKNLYRKKFFQSKLIAYEIVSAGYLICYV